MTQPDSTPADEMTARLYDELRVIAAAHLRHDRNGHTLQPTALVNEAYVKLAARSDLDLDDKRRFFGLASVVMRNLLVDHARARNAAKRSGDGKRLSLSGLSIDDNSSAIDVEALDQALTELSELDERVTRVVELRFFGGLGEHDVAQFLGVSRAAVTRDWRMARAWLARRLRPAETDA